MKLRKGKPEDAGMSSNRLNHVRELAAGWVADGITPSLVILAARRGEFWMKLMASWGQNLILHFLKPKRYFLWPLSQN